MLTLVFVLATAQEPLAERTPSVYRCPAIEGEHSRFRELVFDHHFSEICVEPKPGPLARSVVQSFGKGVKFVEAKVLDTKDNLAWRNATIDFVNGKISPKTWLALTQKLKTTAHFLTTPKTPDLRTATGGTTLRAVFAELLVLAWPGKPCLTHTDTWKTRYHPDNDRLMSWILSMNDWLGPMMYYRCKETVLVTGKPKIIRADAVPGLLVFQQTSRRGTLTYYLNNGTKPIELSNVDLDRVTITRAIDLEGPKPKLNECGFLIEDKTPD